MVKIIEPLIGKKTWMNAFEVVPGTTEVDRAARLKALLTRASGVVALRIRPGLLEPRGKSSEVAAQIAQFQAQLETEGAITVTTSREFDPQFRVHRVTGHVTVPADTVVQMGVRQALLLLDREPYSFLFEEVDTGAALSEHAIAKSSGDALASAAQDKASMAARLERLERELAAERRARKMAERMALANDAEGPQAPPDKDGALPDEAAEPPAASPQPAQTVIPTETPTTPPPAPPTQPRPGGRSSKPQ